MQNTGMPDIETVYPVTTTTRYDDKIKGFLIQYYAVRGKNFWTEHMGTMIREFTGEVAKDEIMKIKPDITEFGGTMNELFVSCCNLIREIKNYYEYLAKYNSRSEALERAFMEWNQCYHKKCRIQRACENMHFGIEIAVLRAFSLVH
jgi:hypothetical protein